MIRRPPRSTRKESSAASDVYKRQEQLMLFEKDNLAVNVDKSLENLDINPQDTLQILKNIVGN